MDDWLRTFRGGRHLPADRGARRGLLSLPGGHRLVPAGGPAWVRNLDHPGRGGPPPGLDQRESRLTHPPPLLRLPKPVSPRSAVCSAVGQAADLGRHRPDAGKDRPAMRPVGHVSPRSRISRAHLGGACPDARALGDRLFEPGAAAATRVGPSGRSGAGGASLIRDQTARRDPLLQPLLLSGVWAGLALVFLTLIGDQPIQAAALMVVVLISVVTWRWPVAVTVVFVALIPVNRFLILLLFHFTHSDTLTKFAQLWKDWLLVLLLARVVHVALFSKDSKTVKVLDVLVFAFIALTLVYLVWDGGGSGVDVTTRIYGARLDAFFLIAYFVGRGLTLERKHVRRIALALIPGSVLVGLVALWQMIQPAGTNRLLDALDYQGFMRLQGTTGEAIAVRARFFQGGSIPRASSLMLGDLALAFFQIFVVALAAAIFFTARTNRARIWSGAFLLLMAATEVMTVTRSATIGVLVVIAVLAILAMAVFRLALFGLIGGLGCVIALLALGPQTAVLNQLLNPQEESLLAH